MENLLGASKGPNLYKLILIICCIAFGIALVSYGYTGSFMRYSGDDYCYGGVLTTQGFFNAQWHSYFQVTPYSGNRYSLTLFAGIAGLFPPVVNGVLPALTVGVWVAGLIYTIQTGMKLAGVDLRRLETLLLAEGLVFLSLYQAPDISQSLYWRSGMLPYLAPLVLNTLLFGLTLYQIQQESVSSKGLGGIGALALLAGGFSETGATLQLGLLLLLFLGVVIMKKSEVWWGSRGIRLVGAALIGTMLAILLLVLSPTNQLRQVAMQLPPPPDIITLTLLSSSHAKDFIVGTFKALPTPSIFTFVFFTVISYLVLSRQTMLGSPHWRRYLLTLLLIPGVVFIAVVFCMAAFAYAQSAYPEPRALIAPRYVMVLGAALLSWYISAGLLRVQNLVKGVSSYIILGASVLLLALSFYPLRAANIVFNEVPLYRKWATFWDTRDEEIRSAQEAGILDIEVVEIDHIIPRVGDLSPDPENWYNNCAEAYYGVRSISANKPGWDED